MTSHSSTNDGGMQGGDIAELRRWYRQLIKMNPRDVSAWLQLADTFDNPADQVSILEDYLKNNPGDEQIRQQVKILRVQAHNTGKLSTKGTLLGVLDKSIPSTTITGNKKYLLEFSILSGILIAALVAALFFLTRVEGSFLYRPNTKDAFKYIQSIVNRDLLTYHPYGGGTNCQHKPEWYHLHTEPMEEDTYWIKGSVVSANWECVQDVSQFFAKVNYSKESRKWELLTKVTYLNPCIMYPEIQCAETHWDTDWHPDQ